MYVKRKLRLLAILGLSILAFAADPPPPPKVFTAPPSQPGKPLDLKVQNLARPDDGYTYGNVIIRNSCSYPVYLFSVGAWYLGGHRDGTTGFAADEEQYGVEIQPQTNYSEPYRSTAECPNNAKGEPVYCPEWDKLGGQGISMKISKFKNTQNVTQFEYALYHNPNRPDKFKRLDYDFSMLDCGVPPEGGVTDMNGTPQQHERKIQNCTGYEGGVAITFDKDPKNENCPPIYCDGKMKCMLIYTWDRSRQKEASWECTQEYRGDMTLDLCVNNGGAAGQVKGIFDNWAKTATLEVLQLHTQVDGKVVAPSGGAAPTAAPPPASARQIVPKPRKKREERDVDETPRQSGEPTSIVARNMSGFHWPDPSNKQPTFPASLGATGASVLVSRRDDASSPQTQAGATDVAITSSYDSSTLNTVTSPPDSGDASAGTETPTSAADAGQPTDTTNPNDSTANPVNSASGAGEANSNETPTAAPDAIASQATAASSAPSLLGGSQPTWTNASSNMLSTAEILGSTLNTNADCTGSPAREVTVVITTTVTALGEPDSPSPKR